MRLKSSSNNFLVLLRNLNKLRRLILFLVFVLLIVIPVLHVYQSYVAAHAYDFLSPSEKRIYDIVESLVSPFAGNSKYDLNVFRGNTWSGLIGGIQISDPLAVVSQIAASQKFYWPFILTALIPVILTIFFGRFFCGWLCPATLIYELNSNLSDRLKGGGMKLFNFQLGRRFKYVILIIGLITMTLVGSLLTAIIYPPAIIGRELYMAISQGGLGIGVVIFSGTLLFDFFLVRRGFCRYICPGGALYSLLGRYRIFRIRRVAENCNDCTKCNAVCELGLDPMNDNFGQECSNCTACIAICPTEAITFTLRLKDYPAQGPGHLGKLYLQKNWGTLQKATE